MKRIISALLTVLMLMSMLVVVASAETPAADTGNSDTAIYVGDYQEDISYQDYLDKYKDIPRGTTEVLIDASKITSKTEGVELRENYEGATGTAIYTSNTDAVEFTFDAKEGKYNLFLEYYNEKGKNISIERKIEINGEVPFKTANNFTFNRVWIDVIGSDEEFAKDAYGNDIRPTQQELHTWTSSYFYDYLGYVSTPLEFYFKEGQNTIKLHSVKEPMTIKSIKLVPATTIPTYAEVEAEYKANNYPIYDGEEIFIQAERPSVKSDQTLYPMADLSTPATVPYKAYKMLINEIGGTRWQYAQQSITWTAKVEKAGLYKINFKARKNLYQGMISSRKLYINGEIPFAEAEAVPFKFDNNWVIVNPTTADGKDCLIYLKAGENTITMETTQGQMGPFLRDAEDCLTTLNEMYRKILIVTGSEPDKYRDYKLEQLMPDVIEQFDVQAKRLDDIVAGILSYTKKKGSDLATLETMSRQLKKMYEKPQDIAKNLSYFKTNIGSLGTWLNTAGNVPLELDYISFSKPDGQIKKPTANFFVDLAYQVNQFIASFVIDYNSIGNLTKNTNKEETITVWISTGRDQFQTLRAMINDSLTKTTGQEINLELVNMGALLSAIVAGIGPDVALGQGQNEAVNFAMRNAVVDLTQFEDKWDDSQKFSTVAKRFSNEAMIPYYFNDGKHTGVYALPETQSFNVMFYRKDVLSEVGIEKVPQTWEEIITAITILNKNNLEFGMPVPTTNDVGAGVMTFYSFLRQNGGNMYEEDTFSTALHTDAATTAFKAWTNFYVNYGLLLDYDFQNRFRTGEMPLGIGNYGMYNALSVAAPEIRGLWDFTVIPGTVQKDGTIDRSNTLVTSCALILSSTKKLEQSWKFLEWWTRADTQSQYGSELECILGPSARYGTANTEAFERLPWSADEIATLKAQLETSYSIPEVPGGYFLQRHINNAFRRVVYKAEDPKDTLLDYSNTINSEITNKRKEFGLPLREE
ncbi:MAG: ABC transporter substrate-binding protein [Clostridia bacterium]|nr:ABC transporter substrate-binding protein [Clostridia bacterium]